MWDLVDVTECGIWSRIRRWMNDLEYYILFNSFSVIWGQWVGDNERLCTVEHHN